MRTFLLMIVAGVSGCSRLAAPTYAEPSQQDAKRAYIAGRLALADMYEGRPVPKASEFPNEAVRTIIDTKTVINELQIEGGILALRNNAGTDRVSVTDCQWERIDPDKVDEDARPLIGDHPPGAYFCKSEVFVTQNYGIKAKAPTEGYFFKDSSGQWMFIGKDAHAFERY